ncbi:uncharacterized protein LOC141648383 [Silene latifolia]|uniref:uncharacterized protein LOC141648383 n=1 Tax=Silene latifolia TaxID=37657 RepID=UPI003D777FDA
MSNDSVSENFRKYVMLYNSTFAFTSFGLKKDRELAQRNRGIYTFRVQGQVYHFINDILPTEEPSQYIQLYFYDTDGELWHRLQISEDIDQNVVAAIWVDDENSSQPPRHDVLIYANSGTSHRILHYYGCYDPLQYPLLFPFGETGWHKRIYGVSSHPKRRHEPHTFPINEVLVQTTDDLLESEEQGTSESEKKISCREYYCYRLQIRPNDSSILLRSGRLLQQYTVDIKIRTPDQYDDFVCAELPDAAENPYLFSAVVCHMMHGPCGRDNPTNPCMQDGNCKNHYPRDFADTTTNSRDSYPIYRRRRTGIQVTVCRSKLNNRWVVLYNPFLLGKYDCHLNVEICSTIKAVKYMYKYVYKGHDGISFAVTDPSGSGQESFDEITFYQSARWISPPEAAWKIFGFHLNEIHPNVVPLQVHLPNMQTVSFQPWENLETFWMTKLAREQC